MSAEKEWREFQVHDDDDNGDAMNGTQVNGAEEEESGAGNSHHIFDVGGNDDNGAENEYEDVVYQLPCLTIAKGEDLSSLSTTTTTAASSDTVTIRHQGDYPYSTGLAVWGGSELMAKYLLQHPDLVKGKKVLELGSGTGLCSLVSHWLGARTVLATDGDVDVLKNLRWNVERNLTTTAEATTTAKQSEVFCPQVIWDKDLDSSLEEYGSQEVILASDCVYMPPSLEPLWQTVDALLVKKESVDEPGSGTSNASLYSGVFVWVNLCASTAPLELMLETADKYGFCWEEQPKASSCGDDESELDKETLRLFSEEIYLFQRK